MGGTGGEATWPQNYVAQNVATELRGCNYPDKNEAETGNVVHLRKGQNVATELRAHHYPVQNGATERGHRTTWPQSCVATELRGPLPRNRL